MERVQKLKFVVLFFLIPRIECIVDAIIVLGPVICEDVMEDLVAMYEILDITDLYLDGYKVGVQLKFDV